MVRDYETVTDDHEYIEYPLPSTDGECIISVHKLLGFGTLSRIADSASRNEVNPSTGEETITTSRMRFYRETLLAMCTDPLTTHNIHQGGKKIDLTEQWILREMKPQDAFTISVQMGIYYLHEYATASKTDKSGNSSAGNQPGKSDETSSSEPTPSASESPRKRTK